MRPHPTAPRAAPSGRRQALLDAAAWVFARRGYRRASVGDIVARANVARGTFYLYFASKEDAFLAILDDFQAHLRAMLDERDTPLPLAAHHGRAILQRTVRRWLALHAGHRDAAVVVLREATSIDPRFDAAVRQVRELGVNYFAARFRRLQERGLVNRELSPELMAQLQMGIVDRAVDTYVLGEPMVDVDTLAEQIAKFEWEGLQPLGAGQLRPGGSHP